MSAHTLVSCTELAQTVSGVKAVSGTFTGSASYDLSGSVLDLSDYFSDEVRELTATDEAGKYLCIYDNAASNAAATGKIILKHQEPAVATVTVAHDGTLFDASATTDSAVVWAQPAGSVCVGVGVTVGAQFVAASMTALTVEIGDGSDSNGMYAGAADLVADAVASVTYDRGVYFVYGGIVKESATNWTAYVAATGADLDTTSAGSVTFSFYYYPTDSLGAYLPGPGASEVETTKDISGTTFKFVANGTDA